KAVSARYDRKNRRIEIQLSSNLNVSFSPRHAQGLGEATSSQLQEIEISPSGFGIHFPKLDADLYLPAILQGFLGSQKWMASRLQMPRPGVSEDHLRPGIFAARKFGASPRPLSFHKAVTGPARVRSWH